MARLKKFGGSCGLSCHWLGAVIVCVSQLDMKRKQLLQWKLQTSIHTTKCYVFSKKNRTVITTGINLHYRMYKFVSMQQSMTDFKETLVDASLWPLVLDLLVYALDAWWMALATRHVLQALVALYDELESLRNSQRKVSLLQVFPAYTCQMHTDIYGSWKLHNTNYY